MFALLTAAVLAAMLAPPARPHRVRAREAGALAVYRHQLEEIEAERARGLLDHAEAEAAKLEVSRRLLASAPPEGDGARSGVQSEGRPARTPVALAVAVAVPLATLALYLGQGSPGLPDAPAAVRAQVPPEQAGIGELVARVEAQLRRHPEDGEGWEVIAPVYYKLGRFQDAARAYRRAAEIKGESVARLAGFAESSVFAADGIVTEEARRAYERILEIEPGRVEPRFWLALAKEQDGRLTEALADYQALLGQAPADAPWRAAVENRIADVGRRLGAPAARESRGPTAADVAAAEKLSPEARARMIGQMVEGLAERLKRDGRDLAGWQRLVNAYVVLGRTEAARAALAEARRQLAGNDKALAELAALAKALGLGS